MNSISHPTLKQAPCNRQSATGTRREAGAFVTRELNRLAKIGIIVRQIGTLLVRDLDRLAAMLHEMTGE
jgi:hypothetical protein